MISCLEFFRHLIWFIKIICWYCFFILLTLSFTTALSIWCIICLLLTLWSLNIVTWDLRWGPRWGWYGRLYVPKMATHYFLVHMHFQSLGYPLKEGEFISLPVKLDGFFVIVLWIKWGRSNSVWEMRIGYKRLYSFCQDLSLLDISLWSLEPPHKNPAAPKLLPWRDHVKRTSRWKDVSERPQLFQFNQSSQPKCQTHVWGSLQMSPVLPYLTANTWNPE